MAEEPMKSTLSDVYNDTVYFIDNIVKSYDVFPSILQTMKEGTASVELKKKYMLRAIDETWVNIIEDTLPALDTIIRTPSKYIEEREELLPIELSRNISPRSLQHLSQHTNLISKIEGDMIIPSKLLNVYKEETLQTYENRFVNTLINRLFIFVSRRYEIAKKDGKDEKTTALEFKQDFRHGELDGKITFKVEISEKPDDKVIERDYTKTTSLWKRVERLNDIVSAYAGSDFCKEMGKTYIHPPVMHTNAIMKNKNLHQCLELWQFIESYENAGYSMLVEEDLEKVDDEYIKELYYTCALQYLIFRHNVQNDFEADQVLDTKFTDQILNPKVVSELQQFNAGDYNVNVRGRAPNIPMKNRYGTLTGEDKMMLQAISVALDTADYYKRNPPKNELQIAHIPEPEPIPEYIEDVSVLDETSQPQQAVLKSEEEIAADKKAREEEERKAEEARRLEEERKAEEERILAEQERLAAEEAAELARKEAEEAALKAEAESAENSEEIPEETAEQPAEETETAAEEPSEPVEESEEEPVEEEMREEPPKDEAISWISNPTHPLVIHSRKSRKNRRDEIAEDFAKSHTRHRSQGE